MDCSIPGFPVLHCLLEFAQTHVLWVDDAIQSSHPLLPPSPAFTLSQHQGPFQWVGSSHQVAKVLEHQSFQWILGLISFRTDWFDLLAVQGTLESLLQHHSSTGSIVRCSAFFIVQLAHPYMTTGKTIALTIQIRVVRKPWLSLLKAPKSNPGQTLKADGSSNSSVALEMSRQSFVLGLSSKHFFCLQWLSVWVGGWVSGDTAVTLAVLRHHYQPV